MKVLPHLLEGWSGFRASGAPPIGALPRWSGASRDARSFDPRLGLCLWMMVLASTLSGPADAVRPFVTDDARIADYGQLETESWLEMNHAEGGFGDAPGFNTMIGVTPLDWLEVIAGTGVARSSNNRWAIANPVLQGKVLFTRAEEDGSPGYAFAAGATFDAGQTTLAAGGEVDESINPKYKLGDSYYAIALLTHRLFDDSLQLHMNLGLRAEHQSGLGLLMRPYWGIGVDAEVFRKDIHAIAEAYAGDPLEYNAPHYAGQFGARWIYSDFVNIDLTFGAQPTMNTYREATRSVEVWGQVGLRLLFDVFTHEGKPGDADGAVGLFPRGLQGRASLP